MNHTVKNYEEGELTEEGFSGEIRNKKSRWSLIVPLILSVVAAMALWMYVIAANNTCTDIPIQLTGKEKLLGSGYTVSLVEPQTVDLVLRGNSETIKKIIKTPSLVTASVSIFKKDTEEGNKGYIFEDDEVRAGDYVVSLNIQLPEGVQCNEKKVTVRISRKETKIVPTSEIRINKTAYSYGNGCYIFGESIEEQNLVVSADKETLEEIDYIALEVSGLKDLTKDFYANVLPVAYDSYGDQIDSQSLSFEPETLSLHIKVNRVKNIQLTLKTAEGDTTKYTLSQKSVRFTGASELVEILPDALCLNEEEFSSGKMAVEEGTVYEFTAEALVKALYNGDFDSGRIALEDEYHQTVETIRITVKAESGVLEKELELSESDIRMILPKGYHATVLDAPLKICVLYTEAGKDISKENLLCVLQLSALTEGTHSVSLEVGIMGEISRFVTIKEPLNGMVKLEPEQEEPMKEPSGE